MIFFVLLLILDQCRRQNEPVILIQQRKKDMKSVKKVEAVLSPPDPHMVGNGFRVHNFFPSGTGIGKQRMSPFFLLDYNAKIDFSPSEIPRGVGTHPHRGFETVTIAYQGKVAHHDSRGNSGVIAEGDVQWMTAASGILHKEYHEEEFSKKGGLFQMVQLWVNLLAKDKMSEPKYQNLVHDKMGKYELENGAGTVFVIAGEYKGVKGPARTFSPLHLLDARLKANHEMELELPETYNSGILVIEGELEINGNTSAPTDHFVLFKNEGTAITIKAKEQSVFLVLSGEPILEPIAQYGPFLMNTHTELQQAVDDFSQGKFGVLAD
jgi:redox-sensitive bicupin YhaK (pirin superfamily)